jgi:hypothetical protein
MIKLVRLYSQFKKIKLRFTGNFRLIESKDSYFHNLSKTNQIKYLVNISVNFHFWSALPVQENNLVPVFRLYASPEKSGCRVTLHPGLNGRNSSLF